MKDTVILTADLHIREDIPACRTDDFLDAQWRKCQALRDENSLILVAGDIFHHWKPSPYLLTMTNHYLPLTNMYAVAGQHDLPQHNEELFIKSGLRTLNGMGLHILEPGESSSYDNWEIYGCGWGQVPNKIKVNPRCRNALVWHTMTWTHKIPFPGCTEASADKLLKKYPQFDLILTGDNHQPFVIERDGRLLVNPGSMMRTTGAQIDHKPRYYVWDLDDNSVEPVYWEIDKSAVTREHIDLVNDREQRTTDFVARLQRDIEVGFSYEKNMKAFLKKNKVHVETERLIWKAMERDDHA